MGSFAIATPEPQATAAGERAFRAGGNAVDAALAAAAALTVTSPHNCALGGDLFALLRDAGATTTSINASGPAGRAADAEALRRRGPAMPLRGREAVTVPGLVAGWERLHALGGALPWRELFGDAIRLAADGCEVGPSLAAAIEENAAGIAADPGLHGVFMPAGRPLRAGERLRQPALAGSLRELAAGGARVLYDGALGERLAAGLARAGCAIDAADLRGFAAEATPPARGRFRGLDLLTSPPNSQGVVLLQSLAALDAAGPDGDPLGGGAGLLATLLRLAGHRRDAVLADPGGVPFDPDPWLGPQPVGALLSAARAASHDARPAMAPRPTGDTVGLVAVDADGRAVSLIQSLYFAFGALLLEPATGIAVHNRGALFSLEPGHPNELAPGRRPAHTLMPLLAEQDGRLRFALATMGGRGQPQILAQVLLRLLAGASAAEAVAAPRWLAGAIEAGDADDLVRVEAGVEPEALAALEAAGLRPKAVPRNDEIFGHAQAIAVAPGREPDAGTDPRAG
jgi:gamma-glutamyltranspeptidase/glutathione hydrolase